MHKIKVWYLYNDLKHEWIIHYIYNNNKCLNLSNLFFKTQQEHFIDEWKWFYYCLMTKDKSLYWEDNLNTIPKC